MVDLDRVKASIHVDPEGREVERQEATMAATKIFAFLFRTQLMTNKSFGLVRLPFPSRLLFEISVHLVTFITRKINIAATCGELYCVSLSI